MDRLLMRMHDFTDELGREIEALKDEEGELAETLSQLYAQLMPILDILYRIQDGRRWHLRD